ncbi:MAG: acyl-CoA dehydrogenase [Smithellaceae bacterium]|jgi:butyryl-CoA dehydrogenase|nr:acyl-CoA dehydrogenase [Syntrophaceae bacterium]HNV65480.1 acyl-CoA dehydrogenase [Smithellaceae bacterium]HNZ32302.1 acyl-CoA dehydrogenase [Smithellaceae bacterium]HPW22769.1 acyl-CoA dehydrogenase [Smithellaceae bacterium]
MAEQFISERNLSFLLYEVFNAESLLNYSRYADHSREVFDMVLKTAMKMGKDLFKPIVSEMDKQPPEYVKGQVKVHPAVRNIMREVGAGGWIGATFDYKLGGQQLPEMVGMTIPTAIFGAANYSASVFHGLTNGAAGLIASFGTQEMKDMYLPKMMSGEWQGTMALTEPQAGSSLTDVSMTAEPTNKNYYTMKGQKIFISAGDHDGVDNIIHLALARVKDAPPGVKGISLFIIPKYRIEMGGKLAFNDVNCAGIYHKLGYKGSPITQLAFGENDDCRGWLVGEVNKGLGYMFQMMNGARIDVGLGAACISSAAYYASLEYAKERPQGRKLSAKDPLSPQVSIIEHPDIHRMLLFQKAIIEGSLSLLMQCSFYHDMEKVTETEEHENYNLLLELLTPVAKTYPSEMGIFSCSQAIQILGGYGYCDEFPVEQFYRDVRIHTIHEGTTGIQGMDLLGRKMMMKKGKAGQLYLTEVRKTIKDAQEDVGLKSYSEALEKALQKLEKITAHLFGIASKGDPEMFLADATLYLELFGIIAIAWQWLKQAVIAKKMLNDGKLTEADNNFYNGKIYTCRYFFGYELPKIEGLAMRLSNGDDLTVNIKNEYF